MTSTLSVNGTRRAPCAAATRRALAAALAVCALTSVAHPAPRRPARDDEVLLRLQATDHAPPELQALRAAARAAPESLAALLPLAQDLLARSRRHADGRLLAELRALLRPLFRRRPVPTEALLLRAALRQRGHDFEGALVDLARASRQSPRAPGPWLTRAAVELATGRLRAAARSCARLLLTGAQLPAAACACSLGARRGQPEPAAQALRDLLDRSPGASDAWRAYAWAALAEAAAAQGDAEAATQALRRALDLDPDDPATRAALADLLFERDPEAARALVADHARDDAMLLRLARAEQALGAPTAAERAATLRRRLGAAAARGDDAHAREAALAELWLGGDATAALEAAEENFAHQREPLDAWILLEAARRAGAPAAATPVRRWAEDEGVRHPLVEVSR